MGLLASLGTTDLKRMVGQDMYALCGVPML
jgi:hypothetical protein